MTALCGCYAGSPETGRDRDGTPLACLQGVPLAEAYLCLNEARGLMTDHPAAFERLLATGRYQRFTYDCYPYAQLASGQVDAVIDCHLQPYDYLPVAPVVEGAGGVIRSEEHTSELQSLMRISYAVFCLKQKNQQNKPP